MRRKLIKHGESSLTLALPKRWLVSNNLRKGDEVEIDMKEKELIVSAGHRPVHERIEIDITGAGSMIRRIIGATFKSGYDEVLVRFSSFDEIQQVQELVREHFTGFEIVCQKRSSILIKNILNNEFLEYRAVLRRFFLVLLQISEESHLASKKEDFEWLRKITLLKKETDKFADYCRRGVIEKAETGYRRLPPLYTIIEEQEKVADRYVNLCEYIDEHKIKVGKPMLKIMHLVSSFERDFYTLFYSFDLRAISAFGNKKQEIQKKIDDLSKKTSRKEIHILILLDIMLNLIFDLNGPLMVLNI